MSEKSIEQELEKLMDTSTTRSKVFAMSQKKGISYDVAESMYRATMKQMLEDKKVVED